ncbi:hypothetical protein SAMN04487820_102217 [Actinopolyspora mzabensis]|uniref:DUF3093 domain-containing protein n=1 Tax=Actinopolyspora mzabensis TaxID=995066 RepID=A0A1G8WTG9_ACTMZ|nr:hypothetical protein [Actinopolyspora mzabensis]SDJ81544.1 hypothetical protein SAMN04487820_102217 [Actinopolyspora mzabensis]
MTEAAEIRYAEPGSSWWPLLWGPAFALLGLLVELTTPGPLHLPQWPVLAALLAAAAVPWIRARRRFHSVTLTTVELTVGGESVPLDRLALPGTEPTARAARVLGESSTVPKGMTEVPLLLRQPADPDSAGDPDTAADSDTTAGTETVVLAWARFPEALHAELATLLRSE